MAAPEEFAPPFPDGGVHASVRMAPTLDQLARQHHRLRQLARALVRGEHDAEDLAQEAWVRALEGGPRDVGALGAWLGQVTRRLASNLRRAAERRATREAAVARAEALPSSAEVAAQVEVARRLAEALERLVEPHRSLLRDHYLGGLTLEALARRDGLSYDAVKSRLARARAALRADLERDGLGREAHWGLALLPLSELPAPTSVPAAGITLTALFGMATMKPVFTSIGIALAALALWFTLADPAPEAVQPVTSGSGEIGAVTSALDEVARTEPSPRSETTSTSRVDAATPQPAEPDTRWRITGRFRARGKDAVPGVPFTLVMHRGLTLAGEPLARFELTTDSLGNFGLELDPPTTSVAFDVLVADDPTRDFLVYRPYLAPLGDGAPGPIEVHVLPLDATVIGRVLGPEGAPVVGARVRGFARHTVQTAADGTFRLPATSGQALTVSAVAPGLGRAEVVVAGLAPGGTASVELRLPYAVRLSGFVRDDLGRPIEGAEVLVWQLDAETRTDAAGHYTLDHLTCEPPDEALTVRGAAQGFVTQLTSLTLAGSESVFSLDLVLPRGVEVRGQVTGPEGRPVIGALVQVGLGSSATCLTDDSGRFAVGGVAPGRTEVSVTKQGFAPEKRELDLAGGEDLRLVLVSARRVRGTARGVDGEPLGGLRVAAQIGGSFGGEYAGDRAQTAADGTFEVRGLPQHGALWLEAFGSGFVRTTVPVAEGQNDGIEVIVPRAATLAGQVVDASSGAPLTTFTVRLTFPTVPVEGEQAQGLDSRWVDPGQSFDDPEGRWRTGPYDELKPGAWLAVEVSAPGYATARLEAVQVPSPGAAAPLIHRLVRPVEVEVALRHAPGDTPIAGATVLASRTQRPGYGERTQRATSGAAGIALLTELPPGPLFLRIQRPGRAEFQAGPFEVTAAGAPISLTLPLGQAVEVTLLEVDGTPIPDATVELVSSGPETAAFRPVRAASDANGVARFAGVPPGPWEASRAHGTAQDGDSADLAQRCTVTETEPLRVTLQPRGRARVTGRFPEGLAVPDGTLVRLVPDGATTPRATSTQAGVFVLRGVEPGLYRVEGTFLIAGDSQFRRFSQPLEVRADASDLEVTLRVE